MKSLSLVLLAGLFAAPAVLASVDNCHINCNGRMITGRGEKFQLKQDLALDCENSLSFVKKASPSQMYVDSVGCDSDGAPSEPSFPPPATHRPEAQGCYIDCNGQFISGIGADLRQVREDIALQ